MLNCCFGGEAIGIVTNIIAFSFDVGCVSFLGSVNCNFICDIDCYT